MIEASGWRGRLGLLAAGRPAEVWTLAVLYGAGAAGCMFAAAFPMSHEAPTLLPWAVAAVDALAAAALWLFGASVTRPVVHLGVATSTLIKSALIAFVATPQGEIVAAFGYLWVGVYAAHFFPRREAWRHTALITVGFGVALRINDTPSAPSAYVIVMATIWVAVTVLSNLTTRLREHAATDQLTGLLNRNGFRSAAEREHALSLRTTIPVSLVVIDLDGFKAVNDWRGHAAGDQMLVDLARMWTLRLRRCDVIGRHGGTSSSCCCPRPTTSRRPGCSNGFGTAARSAGRPGWPSGGRRSRSRPACPGRTPTSTWPSRRAWSRSGGRATPTSRPVGAPRPEPRPVADRA